MPTSNKRVLVTLKPDTYTTLERLAQSQGDPVATTISKLLDEQVPILETMAQAFEAVRHGREEVARQALQVMTGKALGSLGQVMEGKPRKRGAKKP
jgi:hypothetical protein